MATITFGEGVSIAAGGNASVTEYTTRDEPITVFVDGDSNSTDLDVAFSGGNIDQEFGIAPVDSGTSVTGVDASGGYLVRLPDSEGVEQVELTLTNNAASSTTVSVYGGQWGSL